MSFCLLRTGIKFLSHFKDNFFQFRVESPTFDLNYQRGYTRFTFARVIDSASYSDKIVIKAPKVGKCSSLVFVVSNAMALSEIFSNLHSTLALKLLVETHFFDFPESRLADLFFDCKSLDLLYLT